MKLGKVELQFIAEDSEEMTCHVGDEVYMKEIYDDGWSLCINKKTKAQGLVPTEYIRIVALGNTKEEVSQAQKEEDACNLLLPYITQMHKRYAFKQLYMSKKYEKQRKRLHAMRELISTAERYARDLSKIKLWDTARAVLTEEEADRLFFNIDQVAEDAQTILKKLKEEEKNFPQSYYARHIIEIIPDLRKVGDFINNTPQQSTTIENYKSKYKSFRKKMDAVVDEHNEFLENILITPFQRITRYVGLLEAIKKYTPETHVEHEDLENAIEDIVKVNHFINETQRELQSIGTQSEVVGSIKSNHLKLIIKDQNRKMVLQDDVVVTSEALSLNKSKCKVYLMTDSLILTLKLSSKKIVEYFFHLSFAQIRSAEKSPQLELTLFAKNNHYDLDLTVTPVHFKTFKETIESHLTAVDEALSKGTLSDSFSIISQRTTCTKEIYTLQQRIKAADSSNKDIDKSITQLKTQKKDIEKQLAYYQAQLEKVNNKLREAEREKYAKSNPEDTKKMRHSLNHKSSLDSLLLSLIGNDPKTFWAIFDEYPTEG